MSDLFDRLVSEPRSLNEELWGRGNVFKVFVSSKMSGGVYVAERKSCADTVDGTRLARAWYWERDANAGPYCSEEVCLQNAARSDGLILILGDELTRMTRLEYEVARRRHLATFVFVDKRQTQDEDAREFIRAIRDRGYPVTKNFQNESELETHVIDALMEFFSKAGRSHTYRSWESSRESSRPRRRRLAWRGTA